MLLVLFALVLVAYLATVLSRAHFAAPPPTPIVYDRQGHFLTQIGDDGAQLGPSDSHREHH